MCRNVVISPVIRGPIIVAIIAINAISQNPKPQIPIFTAVSRLGFGIWYLGFGFAYNRAAMLDGARFLSAEQFLLTTLIVKLAVIAAVATMLVRYHRFRHILIFERRGWPDRLVFALASAFP